MSFQSRHIYSSVERTIPEASFISEPHLHTEEKERLAKLLNCNLIQISNWFQNHRRRITKPNQSKRANSTLTAKQHFAHRPAYETVYAYYQPNDLYSNHDDDCPCYHYSTSVEYTYCHDLSYTQPMVCDQYVTYRTKE